MTRKLLCSLLLFTDLTILPGCLNVPFLGRSDGDCAAKEIQGHPIDKQYAMSTALRREEEKPIAKLPPGPKKDEGASGVAPTKPNEGVTGIVVLEPGSEPLPPKNIAAELPAVPVTQVTEKRQEYEPIALALDYMLKGRHPEAIKCLSAYDDEKQQLFLRLLPPLTVLVKKGIDDLSAEDISVLNQQFHSLLDQLRPRSELVIAKMCYCKEVRNFAWYEALPDQHPFLAGTQDRIGELVQLYVELKNFASEPTKNGEFLTKLNCSIELLDSAGKQVWSKSFDGKETTLVRRARLNDFYSRYGFYVPAVPAGVYQLRLRIADETNAKNIRVASKSLEFRVTPIADQPGLR